MLKTLRVGHLFRLSTNFRRKYSSASSPMKGLVLGVFSDDKKNFDFTPTASKFNENCNGQLEQNLKLINSKLDVGQTYLFWGMGEFNSVAVVGLGEKQPDFEPAEYIIVGNENARIAAAAGCQALQTAGMTHISMEAMNLPNCAAEGGVLGLFKYQEFRSKKKATPQLTSYNMNKNQEDEWNKGVIKAEAQNLARTLSDTPANHLTPRIFAERVQTHFSATPNVTVTIHDEKWIAEQKMSAFLSVARGSVEPPRFLELSYKGSATDSRPYVFVGKGVTFDSGGISLKPSAQMDEMRADMGGAAVLVGVVDAIAKLKLEENIHVLIPLTENMPSGTATKPGDVITAMNGKTICVDNTDAEGRLILADALSYSAKYNPKCLLDIATLTGAIRVALGNAATAVYTPDEALYNGLSQAGTISGDRVWRMPLWKHYTKQVTDYAAYDVNNVGLGKGGGSCTAAAFLREFVPKDYFKCWMHLDMAGVMGPGDASPYLGAKGMTGRPTRTLIEFLLSIKTPQN